MMQQNEKTRIEIENSYFLVMIYGLIHFNDVIININKHLRTDL